MRLDAHDHRLLALWAADCAEHVLPFFEEKCPRDDRPRRAIAAGRAWTRGKIAVSEARTAAFAAHATASDAETAPARSAARAAGHAAATAHVASHAAHAATYAVSAVARADSSGGDAAAAERAWQKERLAPHLWSVAFPTQGDPGDVDDVGDP